MSENKLLDLSFEFAVAIVNLVDGATAPKSSYMTDQLARAVHRSVQTSAKHSMLTGNQTLFKTANRFERIQ